MQVSSGNHTMVAWVRVVGLQYPWSFLQGSLMPWWRIVSPFKSRVSCTFQVVFSNQKHYFLISFIFCICFAI